MKTIKRCICLLMTIVTMCCLLAPAVSATPASPFDVLSSSRYAKVFTIARSGRQTVYTTPDMKTPGNNRGPCNAWIDCASDELWVLDVGVQGNSWWAQVSYPVSGGARRTGYIPLSAISANTHSTASVATAKYYCSPRLGSGTNSSYYVAVGDYTVLLGIYDDWVQILYPSGNRYRIAFALKSDYLGAGCTIPGDSSSTKSEMPKSGNYVRIKHVGSGRYLDVPTEGIGSNNTQLQVWDKAYGNQNQIFQMIKTSSGWQIISHASGKTIRLQKNNKNDFEKIVQGASTSTSYARWDVVENSDGTISFRNRGSSKFLNVKGGGSAPNSTPIIQYRNDQTAAMKFVIEVMYTDDVLEATFDRSIRSSDVKWTRYNPFTSYTFNTTGLSKRSGSKYYHPTAGQKIFVSAEYLSPNTVANLVKNHAYSNSTWKEIAKALSGEISEDAVAKLLRELKFGDIPGIGYALGILQILSDSRDAAKKNQFLDAVTFDAGGKPCGVIVYTYYEISRASSYGPLNNGTTRWGWRYYINKSVSVEYKRWTGDNFGSVTKLPVSNAAGTWYYRFK